MYVKKIDWLDEVSKEAIVEVAEGIERLVCFSCPCLYKLNDMLREPLECLDTQDIVSCSTVGSDIKKLEKKIVEDKVVLSKLDQKRASANARVMSTTAEFNKYVEAYLATAEMIDSTERTLKYSNMALQILDRYQVELQKRKADYQTLLLSVTKSSPIRKT